MERGKLFLGGAFFLIFIAIIIKSFALSIPHFVDVHFVSSLDDQADGNRIAGVGVFQSEFDATNPDLEAQLFDANVPNIILDAPSTEFPLLFPAQQNFFPEVLPANRRTLPNVLEAFPEDLAREVEAIMFPVIDDVAAVEFEDCVTFIDDMRVASTAYFRAFQRDLVPKTISVIEASFKTQSEEGFFPVLDALFSETPNTFSFAPLYATFYPELALNEVISTNAQVESCSEGFPELSSTITEETIQCIIDVSNEISTTRIPTPVDLGHTIARILDTNRDVCIQQSLSITECILTRADSLSLRDTPLNEPPQFVATDITPCNGDQANVFCNTKKSFFTRLFGKYTTFSNILANGTPEEVALSAVLGIDGLGGVLFLYGSTLTSDESYISEDALVSDRFNRWEFITPEQAEVISDANFSQPFPGPCESILKFAFFGDATSSLNLTGFSFDGETCTTIGDYFPAVTDVLAALGEDLAPTVGSVNRIYSSCFRAQAAPSFVTVQTNFDCPPLFGNGLMTGLLGESQSLVEECEDDVEDQEKIAAAQGFAISSTLFEAIAFVLIFVALISSTGYVIYVAPAAAFFEVLAAILILSALLVVQSAPVYASVGEGPEELEPTYFTGRVVTLAVVDAIFLFISSIFLCCGTYHTRKEMEGELNGGSKVASKGKEDSAKEEHTL